MSTKSPNPIDKHVGTRVRMRRMLIGMSQERLGDALGITFQQVQKYEKGANRIGASRLHQIAHVLGVSIDFFYDGAPQPNGESPGLSEVAHPAYVSEFMSTAEGVQLMRAFVRVRDARVRRRIVDLVDSLAEEDGG